MKKTKMSTKFSEPIKTDKVLILNVENEKNGFKLKKGPILTTTETIDDDDTALEKRYKQVYGYRGMGSEDEEEPWVDGFSAI